MTLIDETTFKTEVKKCTSCGDCRTRTPPARLCPVFRATGVEAASPRAKVNALADVLRDPARLSGDDVKGVAKLCVHCTRCRDECPAASHSAASTEETAEAKLPECCRTKQQ